MQCIKNIDSLFFNDTIFAFSTLSKYSSAAIRVLQRQLCNAERTDTNIVINPISNRTRNPSREVFGYHPYWMGTAWTSYNFNLISTLAYFSAE